MPKPLFGHGLKNSLGYFSLGILLDTGGSLCWAQLLAARNTRQLALINWHKSIVFAASLFSESIIVALISRACLLASSLRDSISAQKQTSGRREQVREGRGNCPPTRQTLWRERNLCSAPPPLLPIGGAESRVARVWSRQRRRRKKVNVGEDEKKCNMLAARTTFSRPSSLERKRECVTLKRRRRSALIIIIIPIIICSRRNNFKKATKFLFAAAEAEAKWSEACKAETC